MKKKLYILLFLYLFPFNIIKGQSYNNIRSTQTLTIRSILQDHRGKLWFSAGKSLYNYDGYDIRNVSISGVDSLKAINCMQINSDNIMILGCEKGLSRFDLRSNHLSIDNLFSGQNVKDIAIDGKDEWIGTDKGLYKNGSLVCNTKESKDILCLDKSGDYIYAGCYTGLWRYDILKKTWKQICSGEIPLVSSIINVPYKNILYLGTATSLLSYNPSTERVETVESSLPVVKCLLSTADSSILIGTDNGLYIKEKDKLSHILHDARDDKSIPGDALWCMCLDNSHNLWIGTDNGLSMKPSNNLVDIIPLSSLTHSSEGNQISCMLHDRKGRWWLGGSHGLIVFEGRLVSGDSYIWYKMNDSTHPIPHNRIRVIHEDNSSGIWIGGDGGLLRYDESLGQISRYSIQGDKNNWVYDIRSNKDSTLTVITFDGVYVLNPSDVSGDTFIPLKSEALSDLPTVQQSALYDGKLWSLTQEGISITDSDSVKHTNIYLSDRFLSIYFDPISKKIFLGGADKVAVIDSSNYSLFSNTQNLYVTDISINGITHINYSIEPNENIVFQHDENNLIICFSDFNYNKDKVSSYSFRLGKEGKWVQLVFGQNDILLSDLSPGSYELYVTPLGSESSSESLSPILRFQIMRAWYQTWWAWSIYILILLSLISLITLYILQKRRMQIERRRRDIMLSRAKQKASLLESDNTSLQHQLHLQMLSKADEHSELSSDDEFILKITRLIEDNIDNPDLSVASLSQLSGISSKQLSRKLKQLTDMTTVEFIRNTRLQKAALLLMNDRFTIAEVMYMVGFSNASYFTRSFVNKYGMTPSEYRSQEIQESPLTISNNEKEQ